MRAGNAEKRPRRWLLRSSSPKAAQLPGDHEVACIGYEQVDGRYERIATLGVRHGRSVHLLTDEQVAEEIALGSRFHVTQDGHTSYLRVGISSEGRPFVQSIPDASGVNNLSLLPDCAAMDRLVRQRRTIVPLWWWLIPLALVVLTAFFVLLHMPPIDLVWDPIADITYPTPLGADQLTASANLPGEFVYDPPSGEVLHAAQGQVLRLTYHTEPLPSPWRGLAILSGLLALATAGVLAVRGWRGWSLDRKLRREEAEERDRVADAPAATRRRVQRAEERWGKRDELPARRPSPWWPAAGLATVGLAVAGLLWVYLERPRSDVAQQTINVLPAKPGLSWGDLVDVTYPFTLTERELNAGATVDGDIVYDPPSDTPLKAGSRQPLKATFTPHSRDYSGEVSINYINVRKGTPVLAWGDRIEITYGTALGPDHLKPEASVPGEFSFSHPIGATLPVGSYDLVANYHPRDSANWNEATISTRLQVARKLPVLTWPQPAAMTYPTPLSRAQYSYALLPPLQGREVMTPDIGFVPPRGEQRLTLTFEPNDSTNYDSVTASATVTVLPGDPGLKWSKPPDIDVGTPLGPGQLNATASVPGAFTYTPPAGTMLGVGDRQALAVTFQPEDENYASASATVAMRVKDVRQEPPHQAQFLKNGNFEGGFTVAAPATAVGTHWRHFNNGDYHYGYYDDQWDQVWYNANHSQLIEIGAPTYDPGDRPNRLSGISQTVRGLISGERYTLTLHGIIRVSEGDPNTDNLSYVAQWGVAPSASAAWGAVETWNTLPWSHVFPYLSAGPVQSYTTTFAAPSDTVTLFIALLKKPGKGNTELNLNLDGLSLVGPARDPGLTMASR